MSFVAIAIGGSALIGAGAQMYSANKASKDLKAANKPLDIPKIISDARDTARQNYADSIAMENQYRPGTAALRDRSDAALMDLFNGNTTGLKTRDSLLGELMGESGTNPLLEQSASRILGQLNLGGQLDPETQAAAMRGALSKGGASGISGSGAARGLVARDLGLTSLSLMRQRQQDALAAGDTLLSGRLNLLGLKSGAANAAAGQDIQRTGLLAGLIDARALPESGLSPGSVASLYTGEHNAQNQARTDQVMLDAQKRNAAINGILGLGSTAASLYAGGAFTKKAPTTNAGPIGLTG